MYWNRRGAAALTAAIAATLTVTAVFAVGTRTAHARRQDVARLSFFLFRGDLSGGNISLGGWGSGLAEATKEATPPFGSQAIKITTHGLYQGGRLDFVAPPDLGPAFQNPSSYIRFTFRFQGTGSRSSFFDASRSQDVTQGVSPFKQMRYLLTMADGTRYELLRPAEIPPTDDPDSWVQMSFPLAAITKLNKGNIPSGDGAKLKSVAIFGDKYQQFYLAEINTLVDETDITILPLDDQIYFADQETIFAANAEGGAATLRYSWDFDEGDGIQEDSVGRVISHVFPRSGGDKAEREYKITLTVSDYDGIKKAAKIPLKVTVSD